MQRNKPKHSALQKYSEIGEMQSFSVPPNGPIRLGIFLCFFPVLDTGCRAAEAFQFRETTAKHIQYTEIISNGS